MKERILDIIENNWQGYEPDLTENPESPS